VGAFAYVAGKILQKLSKLSIGDISAAFDSSIRTGKIVLPRELAIFNESIDLVSMVMLYYLVRLYKPETVVETGVWTGKSSWFILKALHDNGEGRLYSVDLGLKQCSSQQLPTKEIGGLVPSWLKYRWNLKIGDSKQVLPSIVSRIASIDLFYHDSDHSYEHMMFEFKTVWNALRANGALCSDDVNLNTSMRDFASAQKRQYLCVQQRFGLIFK